MTDARPYIERLLLPDGLLDRLYSDADRSVAGAILRIHDEAVNTRKRRFATGLAVAFLAFVERLAGQLRPGEDLANALNLYPPVATLPNGRPANTLTVLSPRGQIGLRRYYNAVEKVIRSDLRRYDYPNMAPHATQSWTTERDMLDRLLEATPGARRLVFEDLWGRTLALREFDQRSTDRISPRPFAAVLSDFPIRQRGEPAGAVLQALAYAYFAADAPNVILSTAKVGAGSRRTGRVGDVDGWTGDRLALSVEVKDEAVVETTVDDLYAGFLGNLSRFPDATAIALARSFDGPSRQRLSARGVLCLDRQDMLRNVSLWDVAKQRVATDALRYFFGKIQQHSGLVDRYQQFLADQGLIDSNDAPGSPEVGSEVDMAEPPNQHVARVLSGRLAADCVFDCPRWSASGHTMREGSAKPNQDRRHRVNDVNDWNRTMIEEFHAKGGKDVGGFGDGLLLLTTTGAKSGQKRVNPVAFIRDRDRYVIAASLAGAPTNPAWYHNLKAHPETTIEVGAESFPVWVSEVTGEERDRLYAAMAAQFPQFNEYVTKTTRVIPVLTLERVGS